jgi:hypothetical protein
LSTNSGDANAVLEVCLMGFNKSVNLLVIGRSYPLCVRVGDRGGVAWLSAGTITRSAQGVCVSFAGPHAEAAKVLWAACEQGCVAAGADAPELAFGAQFDHGQVEVVVRGVADLETLRRLGASRVGERRTFGVGPRAPRCAWPT